MSTTARPIRKGFINAGGGQIHFRAAGSGPPIILQHDSPRSSVLQIPQLEAFSDTFTAIAIDTPGYGNSTPLNLGRPLEIPDFGRALAEAVAGFGVERAPVYGVHTSSKITLAFSAAHPERVAIAITDGLSMPATVDHAFIDAYMKPFVIEESGGYLAAEWTRVLDFQSWFPWFTKSKATRQVRKAHNMETLHEYSMDLFMAGPHFSDAYRAAMVFRPLPYIEKLKARTHIMCRQDDVLHGYLAALPDPLPAGCTKESVVPDREVWRNRLRELFTEYADWKGAAGFTPPDPFAASGTADRVLSSYVDVPGGQMLVRRTGDAKSGRPILFLHDLPGSARADEPLLMALAKAAGRPVYAFDLPGCNESSPATIATGAGVIAAIHAGLGALKLDTVDVVAIGLSTAFAVLLAASHPGRVNRVLTDALFLADPAQRTEMKVNYAPDLRPQRDGSHLHRCYHMLRAQELSWPWYDGSVTAVRKIDPELDAASLHIRLIDTLKQYAHFAEPILAACEIDVEGLLPKLGDKLIVAVREDDVRYAAAARSTGQKITRPGPLGARVDVFAKALSP